MTLDNRLDLRIDPDLKARVRAEAENRGQSLTVFVTRALEAALSTESHASVARANEPGRTDAFRRATKGKR
jgi:uncharacterized protein (DUF1778 family)